MKIRNVGCALVLACLSLSAQADERALQNALAKAQYMLKQSEAEKAQVQQELADLKADFDKYKKSSESRLQAKERGETKLEGKVNLMVDRYKELQSQYLELREKYVQAVGLARETNAKLQNETRNFSLCFENNKKLFGINQEILGNYKEKGIWEVLKESEPFTGYNTVKLENLIQDYQYKNEDLKVPESLLGANEGS